MRGADGVRDQLAELMRSEVATKIPLLRDAWGLTETQLPDLERVVSGEAPDNALQTFSGSWLIVVNPRLLRTRRVDIDDAGRPVYMTRYSTRIYVWARADDWDGGITARDNLSAAARLALLEYPTLTPGVRGDSGYRLHENTYTEQFGEPIRVGQGGRVWAGAVLAAELDTEGTLADGSTRPPLGAAEQITPDPTVAGPTSPLTTGGNP